MHSLPAALRNEPFTCHSIPFYLFIYFFLVLQVAYPGFSKSKRSTYGFYLNMGFATCAAMCDHLSLTVFDDEAHVLKQSLASSCCLVRCCSLKAYILYEKRNKNIEPLSH